MRGFCTGFSGISNPSQPSSPFEAGVGEDVCSPLDCDSPSFSVISDSYFQIEPAGLGTYRPTTSFNQADRTVTYAQTPEAEVTWRGPPANDAGPDSDNFSIMDLPSPVVGSDVPLITNTVSAPRYITDQAAWAEDMNFHVFCPTPEQPQPSDGSYARDAAYPSDFITGYPYSTRDTLGSGTGLDYNCQLPLGRTTFSNINYVSQHFGAYPNWGVCANGGLVHTPSHAPATAPRPRRKYPRRRKRPNTGRVDDRELESRCSHYGKPEVRVIPQLDIDITAGTASTLTRTDFCAKCLFPGCENVMWATAKKKASDNLLQSHQKKVHPQWWKNKSVDARCAVSEHDVAS